MEMLDTTLDAVNLCLSGIGREPVSSLETSDLDSAMAQRIIDQCSLDIQSTAGSGWWFNRESNWKMQPNSRGEVYLPNNTLAILEARGSFYDQGNRLTVRGEKVYDTDQHTFDLRHALDKEGVITLTIVTLLKFEHLPVAARNAISWRARRIFSDDTIGDTRQHEINVRNEREAMVSLYNQNRKTLRSNYLRDNASVQYRLGSVGGYNNLYG